MKKVLGYSLLLVAGLVGAQLLVWLPQDAAGPVQLPLAIPESASEQL